MLLSQWLEGQMHNVAWLSPHPTQPGCALARDIAGAEALPGHPARCTQAIFRGTRRTPATSWEIWPRSSLQSTQPFAWSSTEWTPSPPRRTRLLAARTSQPNRPPPLHLALAYRDNSAVDPGPYRLGGRIVELRSKDLAFTLEEINVLAAKTTTLMGGKHQLRELFRQTAGWPACVALALRSLREAADPDAPPLGDIAANNRQLADYLDQQIVRTLSDEERLVLSSTSVCRELVAAQANALAGHRSAGSILTGLADDRELAESAGSGRKVFLVRPMIRAFFRAKLVRMEPDELLSYNRIAALWHERAGEPEAALSHAIDSTDNGLIGEILERHGATLLGSGEFLQVRRAWRSYPTPFSPQVPSSAWLPHWPMWKAVSPLPPPATWWQPTETGMTNHLPISANCRRWQKHAFPGSATPGRTRPPRRPPWTTLPYVSRGEAMSASRRGWLKSLPHWSRENTELQRMRLPRP